MARALKFSPMRAGKVSSAKTFAHKSLFKTPRSPFKPNETRRSPYKKPTFVNKSRLYTIREESPEIEGPAEDEFDLHRDVGDFIHDVDEESMETESDFDGWDDEKTLVAKLQSDVPQTSERDRLAALAYELEAPMQAQGATLKQYLAHTIAPVAKRVKEVHNVLEQRVDVAFGIGVLSFDDTCKKMENMALHDEDDLKNMYIETQRNLKELFIQLKEAYSERDGLWTRLRESIDESAACTIGGLSSLPADLDHAITGIEKKAKELAKNGAGDGRAREKMLRELLGGM